jgi:hypothetical protein
MTMATLSEMSALLNDPTLTDRAKGACIAAAVAINYEDVSTLNHAARIAWAKSALIDPIGTAPKALHYVIAAAAAASLTQVQISALDDPTFQTYVNASVNVLA